MPTSYPGAFDALTNPATSDPLTAPSHAGQHTDANDAIEALQVRVGRTGTSFPGTPASGDRFLRTDRNIEYFYDGTRWLSVQLLQHRMHGGDVVSATTGALGRSALQGSSEGVYLTRWISTLFHSAAHSGTDYYTAALKVRTTANATSTVTSYTTASQTVAARWNITETAINTAYTTGNLAVAEIDYTKTLAAGDIIAQSTIEYRLVG